MSNFKPHSARTPPEGLIFGEASTMHHEKMCVFVRGEHSVCASILVDMFRGTMLLRLKPSELTKLHTAIGEALKYMEER